MSDNLQSSLNAYEALDTNRFFKNNLHIRYNVYNMLSFVIKKWNIHKHMNMYVYICIDYRWRETQETGHKIGFWGRKPAVWVLEI